MPTGFGFNNYGATAGPQVNQTAGFNPYSFDPGAFQGGPQTSYGGPNAYAGAGTGAGSSAAGGSTGFDWSGLLGNLFGGIGSNLGSIGGGLVNNNINTTAYDRTMRAANAIQYQPSTINGYLGDTTGKVGPNGQITYNTALNGAGNTIANSSNGLISAGQKYIGNPGDPNQIANQMYGQLNSLAAPGETSQIEGLKNWLQSSGRGALVQNGELGDVGGMTLALQNADTARRLQSMQYGNDLNAQRTQLGMGLVGQGQNGLLNLNNATASQIPMGIQAGYGPMNAAVARGDLASKAAYSLAQAQKASLAGVVNGMSGPNGGGGTGGSGFLGQMGGKVGTSLGNGLTGLLGRIFGNGQQGGGAAGGYNPGAYTGLNYTPNQSVQDAMNAFPDYYSNFGDPNYQYTPSQSVQDAMNAFPDTGTNYSPSQSIWDAMNVDLSNPQ